MMEPTLTKTPLLGWIISVINGGSVTRSVTTQLAPSTAEPINLRVEYDFTKNISKCRVKIPSYLSVSNMSGFRTDGEQLVWDGQTQTAWFVGSFDPSSVSHNFMANRNWAIISRPRLHDENHYSSIGVEPDLKRRYNINGEGVTTSDGKVMYLGPYDEYTHKAANQQFRLVVPEAAELRESPDDILTELGDAARRLQVGGRNPSVVAIAAPSGVELGLRGVQSGANGFWTKDQCRLKNARNTWIHEYIHTRQKWNETDSTKWIAESISRYYAPLFAYRQGHIPFRMFYEHISTTSDSGAVLADPSQWNSSDPSISKGRRVLASLDAKIRLSTGGDESFQDVFRRLNECDEQVSHEVLSDAVTSVAGPELVYWLDQYVCGTASPDVPKDESVFNGHN